MATILLTGLSDHAAARLKHSAAVASVTPAQLVERLLDLDERVRDQRFGVSAETGSLAGNVPASASSSGSSGSSG